MDHFRIRNGSFVDVALRRCRVIHDRFGMFNGTQKGLYLELVTLEHPHRKLFVRVRPEAAEDFLLLSYGQETRRIQDLLPPLCKTASLNRCILAIRSDFRDSCAVLTNNEGLSLLGAVDVFMLYAFEQGMSVVIDRQVVAGLSVVDEHFDVSLTLTGSLSERTKHLLVLECHAKKAKQFGDHDEAAAARDLVEFLTKNY